MIGVRLVSFRGVLGVCGMLVVLVGSSRIVRFGWVSDRYAV